MPLDDAGIAQAKRAAPFLASYEPVFVWSSDLTRARETAEHLAALTGCDVVVDARLREFGVGVREGLTFDEFRVRFPDLFLDPTVAGNEQRPHRHVPGSESAEEVRRRMVEVLAAATDALSAGETGVLVGHGASLRTGLLAFFGVPHELREMLAGMANCAWAVLEQHGERGWQIIDYNAQTLPEPLELADDLNNP